MHQLARAYRVYKQPSPGQVGRRCRSKNKLKDLWVKLSSVPHTEDQKPKLRMSNSKQVVEFSPMPSTCCLPDVTQQASYCSA